MTRRKEDPRRRKLAPLLLHQNKDWEMLHFEVQIPGKGLVWYYAKREKGKIKLSPRQNNFYLNKEQYGDLTEAASYAFMQMDLGLISVVTVPVKNLPLPQHGQTLLAFDPQSA